MSKLMAGYYINEYTGDSDIAIKDTDGTWWGIDEDFDWVHITDSHRNSIIDSHAIHNEWPYLGPL